MSTIQESAAGASPEMQENPGPALVAKWTGAKSGITIYLFRAENGDLLANQGERGDPRLLTKKKWAGSAIYPEGQSHVYRWSGGAGKDYIEIKYVSESEKWTVKPLSERQYAARWLVL